MRVDVAPTPAFIPQPFPQGVRAVVIDVVRAMTSVAWALASGCDGVCPVGNEENARERARQSGAILGGERKGLPPEGFDLGNSPSSYDRETVGGRLVVLTTSNGTAAVESCLESTQVFGAAFANVEATARRLAEEKDGDILIVCAGSAGEIAIDDLAVAGSLMGSLALLAAAEPEDGARTAAAVFDHWKNDLPGLLKRSLSGRKVAGVGLESDLADCVVTDSHPFPIVLDEEGVFRRGD
ncbi:MAG: 2-phosphosulfolactate phosphatase [Planctomycetota bacterium]|nr:2-phosphosulfolactate phosphatase [Planctomycetota bacterium]